MYNVFTFTFDVIPAADFGKRHILRTLSAPVRPSETLKVNITEVCAYFEIVNLDHHVPILCLRTSLDSTMKDWNRKVGVDKPLTFFALLLYCRGGSLAKALECRTLDLRV